MIDSNLIIFTGFGEHFNWQSFDQGLAEAKETNKPVMLVIHKTWCGACKGKF